MKNHFLIMCLAAALFAGCSKEPDTLNDNSPATHISAKAQGKGDIPMDTKAPLTGTSMDGLTADVYASTYDISGYKGSLAATFSGVYGHGTMTFGTDYVRFDASDFGGLNGGSTLLPSDGSTLYLYGFYPKGWTSVVDTPGDPTTTYENLYYIFDGKTDVMSSWLTSADDVKIKSEDATLPDRAILTFQHLLTRYTICVKASDATAATTWGRVKSVKIKDLDETNSAWCDKSTTDQPMVLVCMPHPTTTTPTAFYKLTGSDISSPTYSDTKFEATDYATSQPLTTTAANACYTMVAPIDIMDADPLTPELTLEVVTIDALGTELTSEIPVSLRQDKFPEVDGTHLTRGYSISLTLNFRVGMIQAIAAVDEWKEFGKQNIDVNRPSTRVKIGEFRDGGIVYWIDPADKKNYKILSLTEGSSLKWAASDTYVLGTRSGQDAYDGQWNMSAIKAYFEANKGTVGSDFSAAFPAAAFCDALNKDGVTGWYLPAGAELRALYEAYTGNKLVIEAAIAANSGTAMTNGTFWSGTEAIDATNQACDCHFSSDGYTHQESKGNTLSVRCVKYIAPTKIGDPKDGGIVYWIDANDAKLYKVVSLDEKLLELSTNSNLEPRDDLDTRDQNDGRITLAALKRFATSKSVDYATTYPASAWCESKGAGWYQPAQNELYEIYQTWTSSVIFKSVMGNYGTQFNTSKYPSSTWDDSPGSPYMSVDFTNGASSSNDAQTTPGLIRCIKSTLPPPFAIGDWKDGGIVYEVTDAEHYKVFSLTEGSSLMWSAKDTYVLDAAGQNDPDGKKNVAAMQAYSTAHTGDSDGTTKTTGVFATDFPAAGFCEALNTGGVTGWYLPAMTELNALSGVYTANKSALDAALAANSGTAIASGKFWSSSEYMISAAAYYVNLSTHSLDGESKTSGKSVRCVKSFPLPPPPPAIGELKDGGIIYEVTDADNYKVFSLTQGSSLKWSAKDTYALGATGQDVTDGKKNMAAMQAYSAAHTGDSDNTTKTTGVFATDFPAAAYCEAKNTGGVTGWYLPAKDELKAFYDAYTAKKAVLDKALTDHSGTAMASGGFWSGTELSSIAWCVYFSNGNTGTSSKSNSYYVRCVRAN